MLAIVTGVIIAVRLILLFRFFNKPNKPPILGVYQQKNKFYYFKFIFAYILVRIRQLKQHVKEFIASEGEEKYDGALHVMKHDEKLEEKYPLGSYPKSVDAVYFNGVSNNGQAIICAIARRPKGYCDAFFFIKIEGEELLLAPSLPDTYLKQKPDEEAHHKVQGFSAECFMPMRVWKINYDGEMKSSSDSQKVVKVEANLSWSAVWSPFNYDHQMSAWCLAADMAREPWSRAYFDVVQRLHQTHYEQMGYLQGTVTVDGKQHNVNMPAVRDHTIGPIRDWRNFHRYMLHFIFLENGDSIAFGSVSKPVIFSQVTIGYFCRRSDQTVHPVHDSDFHLYQHGESSQILPKDYGFCFSAGDKKYYVQIKMKDETSFYIGEDREAKLYERWCSVDVNGIVGWGCVECHYNNLQDN